MQKTETQPIIAPGCIKVRRDNIYCDGKIIARYDIQTGRGGYSTSDKISIFSKSGKPVAIAFSPLFETTCRILTESDQAEHFIQTDPELTFSRLQKVVEYLLAKRYLN